MGTFSIDISTYDKILLLQYHGAIDINIARESRVKASSIAKKHNIQKILVDIIEAYVNTTTLEQYEFHNEDPLVWSRNIRIAFVISSSNWNSESARFSENVALNIGMTRKSFITRDEAISWLLEFK